MDIAEHRARCVAAPAPTPPVTCAAGNDVTDHGLPAQERDLRPPAVAGRVPRGAAAVNPRTGGWRALLGALGAGRRTTEKSYKRRIPLLLQPLTDPERARAGACGPLCLQKLTNRSNARRATSACSGPQSPRAGVTSAAQTSTKSCLYAPLHRTTGYWEVRADRVGAATV
jgi:hypothetical protein